MNKSPETVAATPLGGVSSKDLGDIMSPSTKGDIMFHRQLRLHQGKPSCPPSCCLESSRRFEIVIWVCVPIKCQVLRDLNVRILLLF